MSYCDCAHLQAEATNWQGDECTWLCSKSDRGRVSPQVVVMNQLATKLLTAENKPANFDTGDRAVLMPQLGMAAMYSANPRGLVDNGQNYPDRAVSRPKRRRDALRSRISCWGDGRDALDAIRCRRTLDLYQADFRTTACHAIPPISDTSVYALQYSNNPTGELDSCRTIG